MKTQLRLPLAALPLLLLPWLAQAHGPQEHMNQGEQPDCAAMQNMDHSTMDAKDPVIQAMMQQCMKMMEHGQGMQSQGMQEGGMQQDSGGGKHDEGSKSSTHQHQH